jgi:hypothetical protein
MRPRRAIVVLAMLAALVIAPSSVFAARPNELLGAAITPSAGTTATLFALSVNYSGSNAASGVTATVAGKTVALWLSSGGQLEGTWTGATTLPAGSWVVTFQAIISKKPDPIATAGPVSVSLGVTQPPSSPVTSQPSDTTESAGASPSAEPKPQQSAAPSSNGSATPAGGNADPSGGAAAAASEAPSASHQGNREAPHGRSSRAHASSSLVGGAAPARPTATAGTAGDTPAVGRELVGMVLLFGIAGVGAGALLGAAWIIIISRRDRAEPSVAVAPPIDAAVPAMPTVEQRASRRARLRPSDDPILAALGLHDEEPLPPDGERGGQAEPKRRFRRAARTPRSES